MHAIPVDVHIIQPLERFEQRNSVFIFISFHRLAWFASYEYLTSAKCISLSRPSVMRLEILWYLQGKLALPTAFCAFDALRRVLIGYSCVGLVIK